MDFWSPLGLNLLDSRLSIAGKSYFIINGFRSLSDNLLYITLVLFFIDNLDPVSLGLAWSIHFGVLALFDYPTGILGDIFGYKKVMLVAYGFKIISVSVLLLQQTFTGISVFMVIYAIGLSQESGAMESWFDNLYKSMDVDKERTGYTGFIARLGLLSNIFSVMGFLLGGFITTLISTEILFVAYLVTVILIFLTIYFIMQEVEVAPQSSYYRHLFNTIRLFFSHRAIFYYFIGTAILWTSNESIWHTFLSIRLYRAYTGTVAGASIIRSTLFVMVILYQALVVKFIHKFTSTHLWIFISSLMSNTFFFATILMYFIFFPPTSISIFLIVGFIMLYQVPMFLESIEGVLRSRLSIDLIPDQFRNSMYSLLPTLARLIGSIFVIITGEITTQLDLVGTFIWLILVSFVGSVIVGVGLYSDYKNS